MKLVRWRFIHNFEKEERWLNSMCAQGWAMRSFSLCRYEFEPCNPGEYIYRLELLESGQKQSRQYLMFLEDMGVECVDSWFRWMYLRKKTADGAFELYSDTRDRIKHYRRILVLILPITLCNLILMLTRTAEWGIDWQRYGWSVAWAEHSGYLFLWLLQAAVSLIGLIICIYWGCKARKLRKQLHVWE